MKFVLLLACMAASCLAAPQAPKDAQIVKYVMNNIGVDGYDLSLETSDGVVREEKALLKNVGTDTETLVINGFYSYIDSDGKPVRVDFVADENGFQPTGDHIPKQAGETLPKETGKQIPKVAGKQVPQVFGKQLPK